MSKEIREKDVKIKRLLDRVVELENSVKIIMDKLRDTSSDPSLSNSNT